MDLKGEILEEEENSSSRNQSNQTKTCSDCHTAKTPLWRGGPSGPKSLCNACGIKYNKKRRALLGLDTGSKNKKKRGGLGLSLKQNKSSEMGRSLKLRLVTLGGGEMVLQQRSSTEQLQKKRRSSGGGGGGGGKLGEEEQAAILLMALSCGSLYV